LLQKSIEDDKEPESHVNKSPHSPQSSATPFSEDFLALFRSVVDAVEGLIYEWYHVPVVVLVPCVHCLRLGRRGSVAQLRQDNTTDNTTAGSRTVIEPFRFQFSNLEEAASTGKSSVWCGRVESSTQAQVALDELTPDLTMKDVTSLSIDYASLTDFTLLGQGTF